VGCPIRRSRDQRSLASPPGFSQRATSFIASQCQGIHQMPLIRARSKPGPRRQPRPAATPVSDNRRAQGQTPEPINPLPDRQTIPIGKASQADPSLPATPTRPSHEDTSGPPPATDPDPSAKTRAPRRSASVTFANPLYPSINPGPGAAAIPARPRAPQGGPEPARPGQRPSRNQTSSSPNVVGQFSGAWCQRLVPASGPNARSQRPVEAWWR
jgi:hypothetical protein